MIAVDWSFTKKLVTYDGRTIKVETPKTLLSRLTKDGKGEESIFYVESINAIHSPSVILERGCPISLIYNILRTGTLVYLIDNKATEHYRREHSIKKTDENDARIIWELSQNGATLQLVTLNDKFIQLHHIYHQYCRYQKSRVAINNTKLSHIKQYGNIPNLPFDFSSYDIAVNALEEREKILFKSLTTAAKSANTPTMPIIRGLGERIWLGIIITANPQSFKCLSAYLRFCGLTDNTINKNCNHHARMLYHMLSEQTLKHNNPEFRAIYDKCKSDIAIKHPDYTKGHIHNASLNRTATFLAKKIYQTLAIEKRE